MFLLIPIFSLLLIPSLSLKCGYSSFEGCVQCLSDNSGCSQCEAFNASSGTDGYAYSNSTASCVKCLDDGSQSFLSGCRQCNHTQCNSTGCVKGYYFSQSQCLACPAQQNCLDCITATNCSQCKTGFYMDKGNCVNCSKISVSCTDCSSSTCNACGSGYSLNSKGGCDPCLDPNCTKCDQSSCITCIPGYYPQNKQCLPCSVTNCSSCPNDHCVACSTPMALNESFWPLSCVNCSDNSTFLTPGCSKCAFNADLKTFVCQTCADGYFLKNGNCSACPNNSSTCLDTQRSLTCKTDYVLTKLNANNYECRKQCDSTSGQYLLKGGTCYICSAYYQGNCTKCDANHCLQCSAPTPYLRPPWNISCESCDLASVDLPQSTMLCFQNASATISSIVPNSENVFSINLACQVPSTIFAILALEWGSSLDDTGALNSISLDYIRNLASNQSQMWIDRDVDDSYWKAYGKLQTDLSGNYYGPINASIKLSGEIYDIKIWCVSLSGGIVSFPVSKQFYPQYNYGYISVMSLKCPNNTLTTDNKWFLGKVLYSLLKLDNAQRVLYTDDGKEINSTNAFSRLLVNTTNATNTTNSTNSTNNNQTVYEYLFYSPPNWTLNADSSDVTIGNLISDSSFLPALNKAVSSLNVTFTSASSDSRDEQSTPPSFSAVSPIVINSNQSLQFTLQINKANGYIHVAVAESHPNTSNSSNSTSETVLADRLPSWDQFAAQVNKLGTPFKQYQKIYTYDGKKNVITFGNLSSNTTYDVYFGASNSDFPFLRRTDIYGVWTFTKVNVFGMRLDNLLGILTISMFILLVLFN